MPGDRVWSVGHGIKIQVDYFHGTADAFFLTHCHADHISGLKAGKNRSSFEGYVYCTEITKKLLLRKEIISKKCARECLQVLTAGFQLVPIEKGGKTIFLDVIVIDANHCPGSAMFLINSGKERILFTGDFRYEPSLHGTESADFHFLRDVDKIVIDTTLWDESWQHKPRIPAIRTKEGSVNLLTRYIDENMPKEVIELMIGMYKECQEALFLEQGLFKEVATDSHGQEDLIMGLYARYQEPLFLDMDQSDRLPSRSRQVWESWLYDLNCLGGAVTSDRNIPTRFRACPVFGSFDKKTGKNRKFCLGSVFQDLKMKVEGNELDAKDAPILVRASTLAFAQINRKQKKSIIEALDVDEEKGMEPGIIRDPQKGEIRLPGEHVPHIVRVLYSMHSPRSELDTFIDNIKDVNPKVVVYSGVQDAKLEYRQILSGLPGDPPDWNTNTASSTQHTSLLDDSLAASSPRSFYSHQSSESPSSGDDFHGDKSEDHDHALPVWRVNHGEGESKGHWELCVGRVQTALSLAAAAPCERTATEGSSILSTQDLISSLPAHTCVNLQAELYSPGGCRGFGGKYKPSSLLQQTVTVEHEKTSAFPCSPDASRTLQRSAKLRKIAVDSSFPRRQDRARTGHEIEEAVASDFLMIHRRNQKEASIGVEKHDLEGSNQGAAVFTPSYSFGLKQQDQDEIRMGIKRHDCEGPIKRSNRSPKKGAKKDLGMTLFQASKRDHDEGQPSGHLSTSPTSITETCPQRIEKNFFEEVQFQASEQCKRERQPRSHDVFSLVRRADSSPERSAQKGHTGVLFQAPSRQNAQGQQRSHAFTSPTRNARLCHEQGSSTSPWKVTTHISENDLRIVSLACHARSSHRLKTSSLPQTGAAAMAIIAQSDHMIVSPAQSARPHHRQGTSLSAKRANAHLSRSDHTIGSSVRSATSHSGDSSKTHSEDFAHSPQRATHYTSTRELTSHKRSPKTILKGATDHMPARDCFTSHQKIATSHVDESESSGSAEGATDHTLVRDVGMTSHRCAQAHLDQSSCSAEEIIEHTSARDLGFTPPKNAVLDFKESSHSPERATAHMFANFSLSRRSPQKLQFQLQRQLKRRNAKISMKTAR